MKVHTIEGLLDRSQLTVSDEVTESDNARVIATEWRFEGRVVRRDVWVSAFAPQEIGVSNER